MFDVSAPANRPDSYFGKLIRTDHNGTKYVTCRCLRCNGTGAYPLMSGFIRTWGVSFRCGGNGIDPTPDKIYTPEHEAKLAAARAKRAAKREIERAEAAKAREKAKQEWEAAHPEIIAKREAAKARKAQWEAERKASEWVGTIGEKITVTAKLVYGKTGSRSYNGYERDYSMLIFKSGMNTIIWFASGNIDALCNEDGSYAIGKEVTLTATVKDHSDRNGKATIITRTKIA